MQQINAQIPADEPAGAPHLSVCATSQDGSQTVCSNAVFVDVGG